MARIVAATSGHAAPIRCSSRASSASGKTAVYAAAIDAALAAGRDALVLVPEIALALPLVDRLRHDLGIEPVLLHSGLSDGERADEWRRLRAATDALVVVGTRMAVLAPVRDPGVIVVDEEHDPAYKSDRTPRYQARDVALELGRLAGRAGRARQRDARHRDHRSCAGQGELAHLRLADRAAGAAPAVEVVDLRAELAEGNRGLLSAALVDALERLDRDRRRAGDPGHQSARLGVGGPVPRLRLRPGLPGVPATARVPRLVDGAALPSLRRDGAGRASLPGVRLGAHPLPRRRHRAGRAARCGSGSRSCASAASTATSWSAAARPRAVVDAFSEGRLDVLVGTSLVTKGLDVPEVALVGVVSADIALDAARRAGRRAHLAAARPGGRPRRVAATARGGPSSRPTCPTIPRSARSPRATPSAFVEAELERRRRFGSPPFGRLVKLTVALPDRDRGGRRRRRWRTELRVRAAGRRRTAGVAVLGPVPAYIARRAGRWRFHVVLRGQRPARAVLGGDPGAPWSVDVDPESLL